MRVDAEPQDVIDFLIEDALGQAERRDLRQHKSTAFELLVKEMDFVTERREIASDGQTRRTGTDEGNLLAVWFKRALRHVRQRIVAIVGGDAFESADRDGLFVNAASPACWFTRTVAGAAQDPREHV